MKKFLLGALALPLVFAACKKSDDNSGTSSNYVKVGATSYDARATGSTFLVQASQVVVGGTSNGQGASLTFSFSGTSTPTAGTYQVVGYTASPTANQVSVMASAVNSNANAATYGSTGAGTVNVTVTVNSGKLSISTPDIPVNGILGTSGSTTVSCNASQQ